MSETKENEVKCYMCEATVPESETIQLGRDCLEKYDICTDCMVHSWIKLLETYFKMQKEGKEAPQEIEATMNMFFNGVYESCNEHEYNEED